MPDSVLSQAAIDAMINTGPVGNDDARESSPADEAAPEEAAAEQAPAAAPAPRAVQSVPANDSLSAPPALSAVPAQVPDLEEIKRQLLEMASAQGRMPQIEASVGQVQAEAQRLAQYYEAIAAQIQELTEALTAIITNLLATPGYGAHNVYECPDCGAVGTVVIPLTCTSCGEASYAGWWPPADE